MLPEKVTKTFNRASTPHYKVGKCAWNLLDSPKVLEIDIYYFLCPSRRKAIFLLILSTAFKIDCNNSESSS